MPRSVDLRREHPQFWLTVVGDVAFYLIVGLTWACDPDRWAGSTAYEFIRIGGTMRWHGVVYLAAAVMAVVGLVRDWRWLQRALIVAAAETALVLAGLIVAAFRGQLLGTFGAGAAVFVIVCHLAQLGEPPTNPQTRTRP